MYRNSVLFQSCSVKKIGVRGIIANFTHYSPLHQITVSLISAILCSTYFSYSKKKQHIQESKNVSIYIWILERPLISVRESLQYFTLKIAALGYEVCYQLYLPNFFSRRFCSRIFSREIRHFLRLLLSLLLMLLLFFRRRRRFFCKQRKHEDFGFQIQKGNQIQFHKSMQSANCLPNEDCKDLRTCIVSCKMLCVICCMYFWQKKKKLGILGAKNE